MHSLAILVVWKFPDFRRPEVEKNNFGNFSKIFEVIYLLPGESWNAETAAKGPNGFSGR